MTRTEWLMKLETELHRLKVPGSAEIVSDYEEHFRAAADAGKSESQVTEKLGDPKTVARAHQAEALVSSGEEKGSSSSNPSPASSPEANRPTAGRPSDLMGATIRLLLLTPFNFLMLIGPVAVVVSFLVGGWSSVLAFAGVSIAAIFFGLFSLPLAFFSFWSAGAVFFGSITFIGITVLFAMTMWWMTLWILKLFTNYLRWNVDFVLERKMS